MTKKAIKADQPALFGGPKEEAAMASQRAAPVDEGAAEPAKAKPPAKRATAAPKPAATRKAAKVKSEKPPGTEVAKVERLQVAPAPSGPPNMLAIIASAAANPRVDVAKMKELLAMQKDIMAEEARIAFTEAKVAMRNDLPRIRRDGKIEIRDKAGKLIQSTPYATFENMFEAVAPVLQRHGFDFYAEPDTGNEHYPIIMRGHLKHIKGYEVTCAIPLPFETSGSKNNVQGIGSSLSYGRRYCLINLCSIISFAPSDRDDGGASAGPPVKGDAKIVEGERLITDKQAEALAAAIDYSGIDRRRFAEKYGIMEYTHLPADKYDEALKALRDYKAAAAARKPKDDDRKGAADAA